MSLRIGIDIGSTTVKTAVIDKDGKIGFSAYERHYTNILPTLFQVLERARSSCGDLAVRPVFTGSVGMGVAEKTGISFVQEVVAACKSANTLFPGVKSLIDIGGEDAKLVLFGTNNRPDIRMNGSCAGGTGAYIDQMAALMNVHVNELDSLAHNAKKIYPIASRCGVFAKTDVQNLISRKVAIEDIAGSIFYAVASQIINSLARGCSVLPTVLFCGGPLGYISFLRKAFAEILKISDKDMILPPNAELFTALGSALSAKDVEPLNISELLRLLQSDRQISSESHRLPPLFTSAENYRQWEDERKIIHVPEKEVEDGEICYLGIDSGSTTTKITVINDCKELLYSFYCNNNGKPLETVVAGLNAFYSRLESQGKSVHIVQSAVTGYGEDLIRAALGLDHGLIETVAHFMAARSINPEVSFVLDIGGQDIKAIYIRNNTIQNIEINEACSSGCGSFIEGFAGMLDIKLVDFAQMACTSDAPYDLGSRCTVFMNSKIKQALREGASVPDLSAGLAYSVVNNCLFKVLKIKNIQNLGEHIVIQGGTFKNPSVARALELLSKKNISMSNKPELMGAYGAALYAREHQENGATKKMPLRELLGKLTYSPDNQKNVNESGTGVSVKYSTCKGCTNNCCISVYSFASGERCYSGNKCEKIFSNNRTNSEKGLNIFDFKDDYLFNTQLAEPSTPLFTIGIPRILNIYENFPFWKTLFSACGIKVVLSDESSQSLYMKGNGCIMSDNICFPAKLAHGHIFNLVDKQVNRIFYPMAVFERNEFKSAVNSFNCPIVTGYADVLRNAPDEQNRNNIPFDSPAINFNDGKLLKKACYEYLAQFGINKKVFTTAFEQALNQQNIFKKRVKEKNISIMTEAIERKAPLMLLAGHPYHLDHLVHQKVSQILSDLGIYVVNEEISIRDVSQGSKQKTSQLSYNHNEGFDQYHAVAQWGYHNRILQAAWWLTQQKYELAFVQLNSFGCGPDSFIMDEVCDLLKRHNKAYALIRIDEIASPGSIRLRLRSLVESFKIKLKQAEKLEVQPSPVKNARVFTKDDRERTILIPWMSDFYSPFASSLARLSGYKVENLPLPDAQSVAQGLIYANNEVCYPATLVVGDIIKALQSGQYDLNKIAIGISQTGGQCRATNYLALIKRALTLAGYDNVPVVAVAPSSGLVNEQPGFDMKWRKVILPMLSTMLFSDAVSRMYYATVCRETHKGTSASLRRTYIDKAIALIDAGKHGDMLKLLKNAVLDFNKISVHDKPVTAVGVVGEIYVKYNSFGHAGIVEWLIDNGVEAVLPSLQNFFLQSFVNSEENRKLNIERSSWTDGLMKVVEWLVKAKIKWYEKALSAFRFYRPAEDIRDCAEAAKKVASLVHQYGEGWLIPAEVANFLRLGINDVICLQPFGCIANHVIGKGIEKKIRNLYPDMNILFLDLDYGASRINLLNRLQFLVQNS